MLDKTELKLPWQNLELRDSVNTLIQALKDSNANYRKTNICEKDQNYLSRQFKKAKLGKSKSHRFMAAIAKAIGIEKPEARIKYATGKEWERAKEKYLDESRNMNDLERGRIMLSSVEKYNNLIKLLKTMTKDGQLNGISIEGVSILPDKIDNYIEGARKSGWAGALNMDLEVDLGKGRTGTFELQFMPEGYDVIEPLSHRLYEMIRILEALPASYKGKEGQKIEEALILANHALYIEEGFRAGFINVRKDQVPEFTAGKIAYAYDVLEQIGNAIDSLGGRSYKWKQETKHATTVAKTSLQNISIAVQRGHKLIPNSP